MQRQSAVAAKQRPELIASVIRRFLRSHNVMGDIFWGSTTRFRGELISIIENKIFLFYFFFFEFLHHTCVDKVHAVLVVLWKSTKRYLFNKNNSFKVSTN